MATEVDICNMALAHLGADANIASIAPPDGSEEAGHCARMYPLARTYLLAGTVAWGFAKRRVALDELENDSLDWTYKYQLPSDFLHVLHVIARTNNQTVFSLADLEDGNGARQVAPYPLGASAPCDIEGSALYTNEPNAELLYVRDMVDTGKFPPRFTMAVSYYLAALLCGPLVKGATGRELARSFVELALRTSADAGGLDANASYDPPQPPASSIRARA